MFNTNSVSNNDAGSRNILKEIKSKLNFTKLYL